MVQFLLAWATDKTAPPHLQFAVKHKGIISPLSKTKAQQALKNSIISVRPGEHFEEIHPGQKPSWSTAPTMALLTTLAVEINLIHMEQEPKNKLVRSKIDLHLSQEEEPRVSEHFIRSSSSLQLQSATEDLNHLGQFTKRK